LKDISPTFHAAIHDLQGSGLSTALELMRLKEIDSAYGIQTAYDPIFMLRNMQEAEARDVEASIVAVSSVHCFAKRY
jgi:hypothetical protein